MNVAFKMSIQGLLPLGDRAHCQPVTMPPSPPFRSAWNGVVSSAQPRGGVMMTVSSSSTSSTVTVVEIDPDRGLLSSSSVAVTITW